MSHSAASQTDPVALDGLVTAGAPMGAGQGLIIADGAEARMARRRGGAEARTMAQRAPRG
ncbi:hypothetical protein GCM10022262_20890 [Georgenia daeguensis]|uniref:Uncharacterized protein n=1 Tax=Georgenia daeguensis TaxID=908355 RepID=A0ABP8EUS0_9MICO